MKNKPLWIIYTYATIAMVFWGISFVWVKQVYDFGFKPITVVIIRLTISTIMLNIICKLFNLYEKIRKEDYKRFFLLAFFEPFCYFMGESFGMQYVSPTLASVIVALIPPITPIFAWFFIKEKVNIFEIFGLIVSFLGVLLLVLNDFRLEGKIIGYILMFIAVLGGTNYGIVLRTLADKYSAITIVRVQTMLGALLFLPFFLIWEFAHFKAQTPVLHPYILLTLLAIFPSTIAFILLTITVRQIGVVRANIFTNLIPIFTGVLSFFIIGEKFTSIKIIAIIIVILGLFLSQLHRVNLNFLKKGSA